MLSFFTKVLVSSLIAFEVFNLYLAYEEGRGELVFYVSPLIVIMTNMLAIFFMNFERLRGLKISGLLFAYWHITFIITCIRLRSVIIQFTQVIEIIMALFFFSLRTFK